LGGFKCRKIPPGGKSHSEPIEALRDE